MTETQWLPTVSTETNDGSVHDNTVNTTWEISTFRSSVTLDYCIGLFYSDIELHLLPPGQVFINQYLWFGLFNHTCALILSNLSRPLSPCLSVDPYIPSWESVSQSCCLHAVSHPTFLIFPYHPAATDTPCRSIKRACTHTDRLPHAHTNKKQSTQTDTQWQIIPRKSTACRPV